MRERRIPFAALTSTRLTQTYEAMAREAGRELHRDEFEIEDDHDAQERIVKWKPRRTYFHRGAHP